MPAIPGYNCEPSGLSSSSPACQRDVAICEYQQYLSVLVLKAKVSRVNCVCLKYRQQMGRTFVYFDHEF